MKQLIHYIHNLTYTKLLLTKDSCVELDSNILHLLYEHSVDFGNFEIDSTQPKILGPKSSSYDKINSL